MNKTSTKIQFCDRNRGTHSVHWSTKLLQINSIRNFIYIRFILKYSIFHIIKHQHEDDDLSSLCMRYSILFGMRRFTINRHNTSLTTTKKKRLVLPFHIVHNSNNNINSSNNNHHWETWIWIWLLFIRTAIKQPLEFR